MTFSYDEDSDVLYVTFAQPKRGVRYLETEHGDVLRLCQDTGQVVGVTIMYFAFRAKSGTIDIPEIGELAFPAAMTALVAGTHDRAALK